MKPGMQDHLKTVVTQNPLHQTQTHPHQDLEEKDLKKQDPVPKNPANNFQQGKGSFSYPVKDLINKFKDKTERKKGMKLLKILQKSSLKWNDKGEIVHRFNPVRGSNIIVLIKHALRNNSSKPLGVDYFYKAMKHLYIPSDIVQNPAGKQLVSNKDNFRPPGQLVETISTKNLQ